MLVTDFQFCDFFVWTNCDSLQIIIENDEGIQAEIINKAKNLFCKIILPVILPVSPSTLQNQIKKMILT